MRYVSQVAPAELEAVLLSHSDVIDAGVAGMPCVAGGEQPFAWVVRRDSSSVTEQQLCAYVAGNISTVLARSFRQSFGLWIAC